MNNSASNLKPPKTLTLKKWFASAEGDNEHYHQILIQTVEAMTGSLNRTQRAGPTHNAQQLEANLVNISTMTESGLNFGQVLENAMEHIVDQSVYPHHPNCCAHLHCPPLIPAIAAEVILSTLNQSMDSWDQAPAATHIEQQLVQWLCQLVGFNNVADGSFTSGGTQANLMGLLLARDYAMATSNGHDGYSVQHQGLVNDAHRYRILCSKAAHFSVSKSAALLGLGRNAVICIDTDENDALCPKALNSALQSLQQENQIAMAIVATAGTTDLGAIDPLEDIASLAKTYDCWLHVDAAYGGALLLCQHSNKKLKGLQLADSITVDFHKMFFQPISCGALLVKDRSTLQPVCFHADYLSREGDEEPNLVDKSLSTTRRFDALKLWFSLQTLGRQGFADMLQQIQYLAQYTANTIRQHPHLDLLVEPNLTTVLFRLVKPNNEDTSTRYYSDQFHQRLRRQLLQSGKAVIAETRIESQLFLKLTLLNPCVNENNIDQLLNTIVDTAGQLSESEINKHPSTSGITSDV